MMMAVRLSGFIVWCTTCLADRVCLSPNSSTQKPIPAVTNPTTTQADSTTNNTSWAPCNQALPPAGCRWTNRALASAVHSTINALKTARRRSAACCQAACAGRGCAGSRGGSQALSVLSTADPRLFQKPRQGTGVMEPRWMCGAVTALGCRSSRTALRPERAVFIGEAAGVSMFRSRCGLGVGERPAARQGGLHRCASRGRRRARFGSLDWDRQWLRGPARWHRR